MKKLVAPSAPTADDREEHTASGRAVFRTCVVSVASDVADCTSIVQEEELAAVLAIAIDYGYLNDRDDQLQEAARAPIWVGKCDRDRWIGAAIVPTKGENEYAMAELKNDVSGIGFVEVLVRLDNEPAILAQKGAVSRLRVL